MASILRVLAALSLLALPAAPAAAAPAETTVQPFVGRITLAPGSPEKLTLLWLRVSAPETAEHHISLTLDYSGIASFATVDFALTTANSDAMPSATSSSGSAAADATGPCTTAGTAFTCEWDDLIYESDTKLAYAGLVSATPKDTATTGVEGELQVTAKIDDGAAASATSVVRVGEAVDLDAGDAAEVTAAAGGTTSVTPVIRNGGATTIEGAVLVFAASPQLLGATNYRNCQYGDGTVACTFDTALEQGASYRLSSPFQLRPPTDAVPGSQAPAVAQWTTASEWEDFAEVVDDDFWGESGTGGELELEPVAGSQAAAPQSDVTPLNDTTVITLTVSGSREPDLAAVGTKVTKAKSQVTIRVGAANRGPGTLRPSLFGNNQVPALVRLPTNVTAVQVDPRCDEVATRTYVCATTTTLRPDDREYFNFVLHVDKASGKGGQIEVADTLPTITSTRSGSRLKTKAGTAVSPKAGTEVGAKATGLANNVAQIVVTSTGGSGGGLPITGSAGSAVVGTASAGLGLVALGSLLATRRPQRPVYAHAMREPRRGRHRKEPIR
jgi:hypothetical protein